MSLQLPIPQIMLDTILDHLSLLFGGSDPGAARQAAYQMLMAYDPQTMEELALAAQVASFRLQILDSLAKACERDLPLPQAIRLRSSAVAMSREAHRVQRQLDELQFARITAPSTMEEPKAPEPAKPQPSSTRGDRLREMARMIAENSRNHAVLHCPPETIPSAYRPSPIPGRSPVIPASTSAT